MDGDGVMGLGIDACLDQEVHQLIAQFGLLRLDHIQVEDVAVTRQFNGRVNVLESLSPAV